MRLYREIHLFDYSDEALRQLARPRRMFFSPDTNAADIAMAVGEDAERVAKARAQLRRRELHRLRIDSVDFAYRLGDQADDAVFWRVADNFSDPYLPAPLIMRAAAQVRKESGRKRVRFCAAPAPEYFDRAIDSDRIAQFNVRVARALMALGIEPERAEAAFSGVGMASEWRGAMWSAATLAEAASARTQRQRDLVQCIAIVCRFMPISMAIDGLFPWVLAIGSRMLEEAITEFNDV